MTDLNELAAQVDRQAENAPSNGAELLREAVHVFRRYVVFSSDHDLYTTVLHAAATHGQQAWYTAPRLQISAAERESAKTLVQTIHSLLGHSPIRTVNISPAALVRSMSLTDPPTLYIDEYDTIFGKDAKDKHEDLRGIINAGFERDQFYIRWDVRNNTTEDCPTFCMVCLAGIGELPDTVSSRAARIHMRRRVNGEYVENLRARGKPPIAGLGKRIGSWLRPRVTLLRHEQPDLPVQDRAADVWEPLIIVAEQAGEEWPDIAREACVALSGRKIVNNLPREVELLRDLHVVFKDDERLHTSEIINRLTKIDDSPWRRIRGYNGMEFVEATVTDREISQVLRNYDSTIESRRFRVGAQNKNGYEQSQLAEVWRRHCRCPRCSTPG